MDVTVENSMVVLTLDVATAKVLTTVIGATNDHTHLDDLEFLYEILRARGLADGPFEAVVVENENYDPEFADEGETEHLFVVRDL